MNANRKAFLDMIAFSEGTKDIGDDGYNVLFTTNKRQPLIFLNYADHPGTLIDADGKVGGLQSTAAGRYQILSRYFDHYKKQLNLPDFSPDSQDAIAIQLIRECRALEDIDAGHFDIAVGKCKSRWVSLPGAGYGQHENKIELLRAFYLKAGGEIVDA